MQGDIQLLLAVACFIGFILSLIAAATIGGLDLGPGDRTNAYRFITAVIALVLLLGVGMLVFGGSVLWVVFTTPKSTFF